jgi:ubiquinone/menaquinone biosynthesis C-methylase UbiE
MLKELEACLIQNHIQKFQIRKSHANKLPLPSNSFDSVFTFNAVHHFAIVEFLNEVVRILKPGGYLFIYTRLRSQNRRNIWGRYFPSFTKKETRLYELEEFKNIVEEVPDLAMEDVRYFKYQRTSSLDHLLQQAQHHHYSTFNYYTDDEFEKSLARFNQNIRRNFSDVEHITWTDENVLLIDRKRFH